MDMGEAKVAVGLDVRLMSGIIDFLFETGAIESELDTGVSGISGQLETLALAAEVIEGETLMVLDLTGNLIIGEQDPSPFSMRLSLDPVVRPVDGAAPVAGFEVGELIEAEPALLALAFPQIKDGLDAALADLALPLFDPLISQVEAAFFGTTPPSRATWAVSWRLTPAATLDRVNISIPPGEPDQPFVESRTPMETVPALVASIALPGEEAVPVDTGSIVPRPSGIQVLIARDTMNPMLAATASAQVGTTMDGATIDALSMEMTELGIKLAGSATAGEADIDWDGTLLILFSKFYRLHHSPALRWMDGRVNVYTGGIDVDVDMPWWLGMLRVVLVLIGPIGWALDATLIQPRLEEADAAPDLIRGAFREQVTEALQAAISAVADIDANDAPLTVFGHDAWVLDGHYATSLIAFAGRNRHEVTVVEHDEFEVEGAHGESVGMLNLDSGHRLHPEELGRLLISGVVEVPGMHGVQAPYGYYVRTNPNADPTDNLVDPGNIIVEDA